MLRHRAIHQIIVQVLVITLAEQLPHDNVHKFTFSNFWISGLYMQMHIQEKDKTSPWKLFLLPKWQKSHYKSGAYDSPSYLQDESHLCEPNYNSLHPLWKKKVSTFVEAILGEHKFSLKLDKQITNICTQELLHTRIVHTRHSQHPPWLLPHKMLTQKKNPQISSL